MMLKNGLIHLIIDTSRPLPIGKNKKIPGLFKDELGGKIIIEVVAIRPKTYAYLICKNICIFNGCIFICKNICIFNG